MHCSYLHSPIKAAAVLYSWVYCGQQNGGHANHRVCLLVVGAEGRGGQRRGSRGARLIFWGVWFAGVRGLQGLDSGVGVVQSGKMNLGVVERLLLRKGGRLVLGGAINEGVGGVCICVSSICIEQ